MKVEFYISDKPKKKLAAIFTDDCGKQKRVDFGSRGSSTYPDHKDDEIKQNYIKRHRVRENFDDPFSRGSLSRWILWNKKTFGESINDYKERFGFD